MAPAHPSLFNVVVYIALKIFHDDMIRSQHFELEIFANIYVKSENK